jgi:pyocin large subunit-like protein
VSLFDIIHFAYVTNGEPLVNNTPRPGDTHKVRGGPGWVYSTRYNIEAKAEGIPDGRTMIGPMV